MTLMFLAGLVFALALVAIKSRFFDFMAQTPADYAAKGPAFDLREHLNGPIL